MSNVEAIKKAIDFYAEYFEDEVLGDLARNAIPSLEALQRENERLREALKPFAEKADARKRKDILGGILFNQPHLLAARTALASAGEEHHAE